MEALVISGGRPLCGTVEIGGAKNALLPIMAATVIHGGAYLLHHCPQITDADLAAGIIESLGGHVSRLGTDLWIDTTNLCRWEIPRDLMANMRASVLFLGALLARFGRAVLTMPGGCPLGRRPIDLHLEAMARMGVGVCLYEDEIHCEGSLHGCTIDLRFPSVGATENVLLAATACEGTVILQNGAQEPEISDLAAFLRAMGAQIEEQDGTYRIHGGRLLHGASHTILPDRIETATYLCAAAGCGGDVTVERTDSRLLCPVLRVLEQAGCRIHTYETSIRLQAEGLRGVEDLETAPYPGFPTDAQAIVMAAMLRAEGSTRFSESIFERRFGHVPQMQKFGAKIETSGPTALVTGVSRLHNAVCEATDLRAAAALVLTALQAEGKSSVFGLKHLDRGYDNLVENLQNLGAEIVRLPCNNTTGNFLSDGV